LGFHVGEERGKAMTMGVGVYQDKDPGEVVIGKEQVQFLIAFLVEINPVLLKGSYHAIG